MRRIRWRVAVSAALTTIDIALLFALTRGLDLPVVAGDVVAVVLASILSWLLHRSTTFALDPEVRWVRMPGAFALAATLAGAVDVTVTSLLAVTAPLLVAKVAGIVVAGVVRLVAYRGVLATDTRKTLGTRRPAVPAEGDHGLTVVVPAKDESARIGDTVRRLREDLADLDVEVVVVDDGIFPPPVTLPTVLSKRGSHASPVPSSSRSDWSVLAVVGQLSAVSATPSPSSSASHASPSPSPSRSA